MRIITNCKCCDFDIKIRESASNRYELSKKIGEKINLKCPKCNKKAAYHLSKVRAEKSWVCTWIYPIAIIISTYLIYFFWDYGTDIISYQLIPIVLAGVGLITSTIDFSCQHNVRYFNRYSVD